MWYKVSNGQNSTNTKRYWPTDKESLVYVTLLGFGSASAYTIAEKTGLKPPTVYLTLQNLIRKNVAYNLLRSKKKIFSVKNPAELVSEFESKLSKAKQVLPEMLALAPTEIPKIKIHYYQGVNGIRESLLYGFKHKLNTKEVVGFFASAENIPDDQIELSKEYISNLQERGVKIRGITPDHPSTKAVTEFNKLIGNSIRTIPYQAYSAKSSIEAEDTFIRIVMFAEQRSVIIDNAELARMLKQIFEMVWKR